MAISHTTHSTNHSDGTTITTASFTPPDDSLLVVMAAGLDTDITWDFNISDSETLTWTQRALNATDNGTFGAKQYIWTAPVTTGTSMTVTLTSTPEGWIDKTMSVISVTGHDATTPIGGILEDGAASSRSSAAYSAALTTTPASDSYIYAIAINYNNGSENVDAGTGWTAIYDGTATGASNPIETAHQYITSHTGNVEFDDIASSFQWGVAAVEIQAASTGATGTVTETEGNDTLSSAGSTIAGATGTVSETEGDDTLDGAGGVQIKGYLGSGNTWFDDFTSGGTVESLNANTWTTYQGSAISNTGMLNDRYFADLDDNTGDVTTWFNGDQGRGDFKQITFPFEVIARNIGIGVNATATQTSPANGTDYVFCGVQVHVANLDSINYNHFVVGHRGGNTNTIEGKTTLAGSSTQNDIGDNALAESRADIRMVGNSTGGLTAYYQEPGTSPDSWTSYSFPGTLPTYDTSNAYVGIVTYAFGFGGVPFVGTADSFEIISGGVEPQGSSLQEGDDTLEGAGGAVSAIDGTLTVTEGDDTLDGVSGVLVTGSLSVTEGDETSSSTAEVLVSGSVSFTEGTDTSGSTGTVLITASFDTSEGTDTSSSVANVLIDGSVAETEGDDTLIASSTRISSGIVSATEGTDTVSGAGNVIVSGTLTHTEADDTVNGVATVDIDVVLAGTEGDDTLSSVGNILVTGTLSATEGDDTLTSVQGKVGTLNATEGDDTSSGVGITQIYAEITINKAKYVGVLTFTVEIE